MHCELPLHGAWSKISDEVQAVLALVNRITSGLFVRVVFPLVVPVQFSFRTETMRFLNFKFPAVFRTCKRSPLPLRANSPSHFSRPSRVFLFSNRLLFLSLLFFKF